MRTINSVKNLSSSLLISLTMILIGFFTRKVFIDAIGIEYLGLNGVLQNILGMMTLLESGFSASVVYNLYKPIANNDISTVTALIQLYKKVYRYIALAVLLVSMAIYPFLGHILVDANDLKNVTVVYFIFVGNSLIPYFTAHKWSIINVAQQNYKLTLINLTYYFTYNAAKIAVLLLTKDYIYYLLSEGICNIGLNVLVSRKADKLFPYIITKERYKVNDNIKTNIIKNMKAIFLHALGGYFMHSTDNIVISSFVGVSVVGLYSNYTLITSTISSFFSQFVNSISDSIGNLLAIENSSKSLDVFKVVYFINFIIVSYAVASLFSVLRPFICWWLGPEFLLGNFTVIVILANLYFVGMRLSIYTFKCKAGIFSQDKFTPLMQGCINLGLSLLLVRYWGLFGVLLATLISVMSISFWQWPRLVYKYVFKRNMLSYFVKYFVYTMSLILSLAVIYISQRYFSPNPSIVNIIIWGLYAFIVHTLVILLFYKRSTEFVALIGYVRFVCHKITNKIRTKNA